MIFRIGALFSLHLINLNKMMKLNKKDHWKCSLLTIFKKKFFFFI